jgi:hypothetical protein
MKSAFVVFAVVCLAHAQQPGQERPQRSRVEAYALEGLGALPGFAGCGCLAVGFGAVAFMAAWGGASKGAVAGAVSLELVSVAVLPAAAAWGTVSVGERLGEHGSTGWAIGGAYTGLAAGAGAIALGAIVANSTHPRVGVTTYWHVPFFVLGYLAVPVGAVVGYNLGAKREPGPSRPGLGGRLELPTVALAGTELPDHSVEYGVKVQLAGLRF